MHTRSFDSIKSAVKDWFTVQVKFRFLLEKGCEIKEIERCAEVNYYNLQRGKSQQVFRSTVSPPPPHPTRFIFFMYLWTKLFKDLGR